MLENEGVPGEGGGGLMSDNWFSGLGSFLINIHTFRTANESLKLQNGSTNSGASKQHFHMPERSAELLRRA